MKGYMAKIVENAAVEACGRKEVDKILKKKPGFFGNKEEKQKIE